MTGGELVGFTEAEIEVDDLMALVEAVFVGPEMVVVRVRGLVVLLGETGET